MQKPDLVVVFVTVSNSEEAEKITSTLLEKRKAACVNVIPAVFSRFWWQGRIDSADESLLIIKTKASVVEDVIRLVKANHSYSTPEIIALPIVEGDDDYLTWVDGEVR